MRIVPEVDRSAEKTSAISLSPSIQSTSRTVSTPPQQALKGRSLGPPRHAVVVRVRTND